MAGEIAVMVAKPPTDEEVADALQREDARVKALDAIGQSLDGLKDKAVLWRATYEAEWAMDYAQYNTSARKVMPDSKRTGSSAADEEPGYRQTADNITRPKVIITASRLGDMLFPTNEANWELSASPKPDIPPELIPPPPPGPPDPNDPQQQPTQGQPYTPEQLESVKRDVAAKRCKAMETTIKDQFAESKYDEAGRAAIFDGCLYGTGVLCGPVLKNRSKHSFASQGGYNAQMVQAAYPCMEYVDLWSFFPQPSRSMDECEHVFVLHIMPKRGLRQLAKQPGFDSKQIQRLLNEEPQHGALAQSALDRGTIRPDANIVLADRYSVWQYRGPITKDGFTAFIEGLVAQGGLSQTDSDALVLSLETDQLNELDCEVWVSQGIVIKMAVSTLAPGELGYYVFNYEKDPNAIFGRGVAYLCRDDQHATNQLWHAMMLNSMMSAGPQIGIRKGSLIEQGGRSNTLSADRPRVWALNDDVQDIKQALSVFIIPNVTRDIMGLYQQAKTNADEHTMTPMIAQGEPTEAVPTSSGMAMLMNAANVVMRRLAKCWDDDITIPGVGAFYDWNMANNTDASIRGDYCVIPKGASHLLIKDVQAQHIQFATQLFATNPLLAPYMKPGVFARKNIEMLDLVADEMLYTDDEVAEQQAKQGQQPDPETLKANAAMATAQAAVKRAEAEQSTQAARLQFERDERDLAHTERMADISARTNIQQMQVQVSQNQLSHKMAELSIEERNHAMSVIADLHKHASTLDLTKYTADQKAALGAEQIASQERQHQQQLASQSNPKEP